MIKSCLVFCVAAFIGVCGHAQPAFVQVKNHQFVLNNKPYYYIGANYWFGSLLSLQKDKYHGIERLRKELDFLKDHGVTNVRVLAGAEGSGLINGVQRVGPPLQPQQGVFDEKVLKSLDAFLVELGKHNMKAVLFLSNNWEWSGGFQQYLIWNNEVADSLKSGKLTWDEQKDMVSKFYNCDACKQAYNKQVQVLLSRTNSISHTKYINDPAIMAWELANEPRPMRSSSDEAYKKWIKDVAAMIKSKDPHHLVTLGHEGEMGTENMQLYKQIHEDKNVDYLTIHIWPKNWNWFRDTAINRDMPNVISKTNDYIEKHVKIAEELDKPLVLEEFGLPRNNHSYSIDAPVTLRNYYYKDIFTFWQQSKNNNGVIGGCNFWAFGGISRPIPGQVFWKKGDDFMGDPPMEEQGLNSVFDSDKSTWKLIDSFTGK